jgi:hypothetical protein
MKPRKILSVALLALGTLLVGNASAANWEKIADGKISTIFVDAASMDRTGDIVALWYRQDFKHVISTDRQRPAYRSARVLSYYNCAEREVAAARWIAYQGNEGKGKVVFDESVEPLAYADVTADDTGRTLFNFACGRNRKNGP